MSKPELRAKLAALSFSEKIKILERLRDRSLAIAASGLRRKVTSGTGDPKVGASDGPSAGKTIPSK
jgi:hypothetical protein